MNNCLFYGKVVEMHSVESDVDNVTITLSVIKHRKSKGGKVKEKTYVKCEAWDSAASTIKKFANVGTFLLIQSSAREKDGKTIFRIDEFTLCSNGGGGSEEE